MKPNIIRPIVICVFQHNGCILVAEGHEPLKGQAFYRPLGGGIEFGEYSADAIKREISEELGTAVVDLRYLGAIENIFTHDGKTGHEIVMVYDGSFADRSLYEQPFIEGVEDDGLSFRAVWVKLADCAKPGSPPLYPTGLPELLART